jgi:hypothetical protein
LTNGFVALVSGQPLVSSMTLEGVDTTDTTKYAGGASAGTGTFRKITAWSVLSQVKGVSASGGAQQFADITSITDTVKKPDSDHQGRGQHDHRRVR